MTDVPRSRLARLLLHPATVLAGILLGGVWGWIDRGGMPLLVHAGDVYVKLLQMCVIPLLFTAVTLSLSRLIMTGHAGRHLLRIVLLFVAGLVAAGLLGTLLAEFARPGAELQQQARTVIGQVIIRAEATQATVAPEEPLGLTDIVVSIVPENIFFALTSGNKLAVLFFAVLFGVALGSVSRARSDVAIQLFELFYDTFIRIIEWLMYALPFGLFCLAYSQVAGIGIEVLLALARLVALIYVGAIALVLAALALVWLRVGGSLAATAAALRETTFVAFGTANSFAAVPAAMRALKDRLRLDRGTVDLVMPLGITLNPPGSVFHFAMAAIFLANLYGLELGAAQLVFVIFAACLAGVASSGAPGIAALSMITIILVPLGLPVEVAIILLVAIDPIVDPVLTVVNVQANAAATALLAPAPGRQPTERAVT